MSVHIKLGSRCLNCPNNPPCKVLLNISAVSKLHFFFQVAKIFHTPVGAWDSEEHVTQATEILIGFIKKIKVNFPKWTQEQCFKGIINFHSQKPQMCLVSETTH